MSGGKVFILEDDQDLAFTYEQLVSLLTDQQTLLTHCFKEMQSKLEEILECKVAVLDIDLGENQPTGVDAFVWLRQNGFLNKIYFMTGHAQSHPLVVQAVKMSGATVLTKPVDIDRFLAVISETAQEVTSHSEFA